MGELSHLVAQLRVVVAQHRRLIAAGCAGLASLLLLSTIAGGSAASSTPSSPEAAVAGISDSEVAVPVLLADKQLASAVTPGNTVRLIQLFDGSEPLVIAEQARVLSKGNTSTVMSTGDASLIVVAVPAEESIQVAAAGASASLTLVVTSAR